MPPGKSTSPRRCIASSRRSRRRRHARTTPALPLTTRRYLQTPRGHRARAAIYALHRWLERRRLPLAQLTPRLFRQFLMRPHHVRVATKTSLAYWSQLRDYLQWLRDRALISFNPKRLRRNLRVLPPLAHEFLASLAPTLRPNTCTTATRRRCAAFMCGSTSAGSILSGSRVMTSPGGFRSCTPRVFRQGLASG
jgi:hypothetical protein